MTEVLLGLLVLAGATAAAYAVATVMVRIADALGWCYSAEREQRRHGSDNTDTRFYR